MKKVVVLLIFLMIIGSVTVVIAIPDKKNNVTTGNLPLKAPEELTSEELHQIYKKYNITENDIKFARGELPHYLEGTVLYGKVVTMGKMTKDGKVEDWIDPELYKWALKNGYKVINATEWFEIEKKAREEYIKRYGVDPANPKVIIVNGVPLPREYVNELISSGILKNPTKTVDVRAYASSGCDGYVTPDGPSAVNDKLYLWIFEAADSVHKPYEAYLQDTLDAYARFYTFNPGTLYYYHITDYWDASDIVTWDNSDQLLKDLKEDTDQFRYNYNDKNPVNDIIIGWVKAADHNGIAYCDGFHSVGATTVTAHSWWWPHDSIAQHEISHNFNAPDHPYYTEEPCIMSYFWAYQGYDHWCGHCYSIVNGNINYY